MTTETKTKPTKPTDNKPSPMALIVQGLEARREQFRAMLPAHIPAERFERVVITAVNMDPELLTADRRSFFNACARAASDGLLPDKREGALVIFTDKQNRKLVTWMPMVYGLIKKIRQSGEIDSIGARIVYQNEIDAGRFRFVIEDGAEKLYHDPMLWGDRGDKVLVYAYARFKNGFIQYMPIHKLDVIKRRKAARTDKVWAAWEDEMWLKTAIRAIASKLPLSADVMTTIEREDSDGPTEFDKMRNAAMAALAAPVEEGVVTEVTEEPPPPPMTQEPESEPESTPPEEPPGLFPDEPSRPADDRRAISAADFIKNAIEGLSDPAFSTVPQVEEYAQRMRMGLIQMQPPFEERHRLLSVFNKAVADRTIELRPEPRQ